jgi:hypothetical protein
MILVRMSCVPVRKTGLMETRHHHCYDCANIFRGLFQTVVGGYRHDCRVRRSADFMVDFSSDNNLECYKLAQP